MAAPDRQAANLESVSMQWARQHFTLLPQGGAYWHDRECLVLADPHFGKAEHFRRSGMPVPGGTTADNLTRLDAMLATTGARHVMMLGDMFHARGSISEPVLEQLYAWRARHASLRIETVSGNHDKHAGRAPQALDIEERGDVVVENDIVLRHEPAKDEADRCVMAGHVHPVVRLHGVAMRSVRLACFYVAPRQMILPAFGAFTGGHPIRPRPGDRVFAIGPEGVFEAPTE